MTISCKVDKEPSKNGVTNKSNEYIQKGSIPMLSTAMVCRICGLGYPPLLIFALNSMIPGPTNKVDYLHVNCGNATDKRCGNAEWEIINWGDAHKRWSHEGLSSSINPSILNKALEKSRFAINPLNYSKVFLVKDVEENLSRLNVQMPVVQVTNMMQIEGTNNNPVLCQNVTQQIKHPESKTSVSSSNNIVATATIKNCDKPTPESIVTTQVSESEKKILKDFATVARHENKMEQKEQHKTPNDVKSENTLNEKNVKIATIASPKLDISAATSNSFLNLDTEKCYAVKVPNDTKPGDKMIVSLPGNKSVGFEYPQKLKNANLDELHDGKVLLLVDPTSSKKVKSTPSPDVITSREIRRPSARKSAERLRIGHNSYPLQVCKRNNSRIGSQYQVDKLPFVRKGNAFKSKVSYDQVWSPSKAKEAQQKGQNIESFLKPLKFTKDIAMTALHEANYNITTAEDKLSNIILNQARRIANCYDMLKYFHFSIIKSNKNMRIVAEELNTCPESCLLFYYERYKQTNEYQLFKMYRRAEKDECEECGEPGKLLCCDGCNRPYHLKCVTPPLLEVPIGDWEYGEPGKLPCCDGFNRPYHLKCLTPPLLASCKSQGQVKRNLNMNFTDGTTESNPPKRSRR